MKKLLTILIFVLLLLTIVYAQENLKSKDKISKKANLEKSSEDLEDSSNKVLLKSREFIPHKGTSEIVKNKIKAKAPEKSHILLQFDSIPNEEEKEKLEKQGIKLLSYIPNKAWFASISGDIEEIEKISNIMAIDEILKEDKISQSIKKYGVGEWAKNNDGTVNLTIIFFKDVSLDDANNLISNYGGVIGRAEIINALTIVVPENSIEEIANNDIVQWIEEVPPEPKTFNDGSRAAIGVNTVQASPYNLNGAGVVAAEWDGAWVDTTHDDLQGRVTIGDTGSSTGDHATHVAGTMLGNGTLSATNGGTALQWRGMATNATVISYEWWNDVTELNSEYNNAINTYGIDLSQNSWGFTYGPPNRYGRYDSATAAIDAVITGNKGKRISIMWAAGNERPTCDNGQYDCIIIPGTAKNTITVGATNSDDDSMTSFSSWGPTDDGRLKPDVVAPGCEAGGEGFIKSTLPGDTYGGPGWCGTSMATPAVSGSVALLIQDFNETHNIYPLPSTIKAILIHTAKDLGNAGPDYSFGYGRINATKAIDLIKSDTESNNTIIEDEIPEQGKEDIYEIKVPSGQIQLKVTLAWDDYQGTPNAAKELVNDLDLLLISPSGTNYYPYVLNPASPGSVATTGTDNLNNIEQVVVNPEAGIWQVKVKGTLVPQPTQKYSLISINNLSIVQFGHLEPYLINPATNINVTQNKFFNFSSGVRCVGGKCGNVTVTLDPAAIHCTTSPCTASSALIKSRDNIGPGTQNNEPNQPNTIDSCSDGTSGDYLTDESVENITITDLEHGVFKIGDMVKVDITAHCWTGGSSNDNVNFVYSNNTISPTWRVIGFIASCPIGGFNKFTKTFKLDSIERNHTIRGMIQFEGSTSATCGKQQPLSQSFDDADDVTIFVSAEGIKGAIPMNNGTPFYTISNNPQTCVNMQNGDTCNQTWQVNATGNINTTWEFFTIYEPTTYASNIGSNKTKKINITIIESVPSAGLISITLLGFPVNFGSINPTTANSSAIGNINDTYIIKIDPVSTVNVDIYKRGDNFSNGADILDIKNVVYDDDKTLEGALDMTNPEKILTNAYGAIPYFSNLSPSTNKNIYYWISVPESQKAGNYNTTIYIKAVETGSSP